MAFNSCFPCLKLINVLGDCGPLQQPQRQQQHQHQQRLTCTKLIFVVIRRPFYNCNHHHHQPHGQLMPKWGGSGGPDTMDISHRRLLADKLACDNNTDHGAGWPSPQLAGTYQSKDKAALCASCCHGCCCCSGCPSPES